MPYLGARRVERPAPVRVQRQRLGGGGLGVLPALRLAAAHGGQPG